MKLIEEWPKPDMTFDNNVIYFASSLLTSLRITDEIYLDVWEVLVSRTIDLFIHIKVCRKYQKSTNFFENLSVFAARRKFNGQYLQIFGKIGFIPNKLFRVF